MGLLLSKKDSRAVRKAEQKAAKKVREAEDELIRARAQIEAKAHHEEDRRQQRKRLKEERKHVTKTEKQARKTAKTQAKSTERAAAAEVSAAEKQRKLQDQSGKITPAKVSRYLAVSKLVAPIAVPLAYRAAVKTRESVLNVKANRAGVPAATLAKYGGPSAPLRARIDSARESVAQVRQQDTATEAQAFTEAMNARLDNLAIAVDTADSMPAQQRRAAQRAISNELGAIDSDLLARLAVHV